MKILGPLLSSLFFLALPLAKANTPDLTLFQQVYPTSLTFANFSCAVCHQNISINTNLTPYGAAYKAGGRGVATSFTSIEQMDSDGDGFTNIAEINAGSNPGVASSTPNNVPPPVVGGSNGGGSNGGGSGGPQNSSLSSSNSDTNNANMLGNTGCGLIVSQDNHDDNLPKGPGSPITLLVLPLILYGALRFKNLSILSY